MTISDPLMKRLMKRLVLPVLCACLLPVLASCGYHMGSMMHPQIKTIAFADVQNDTKEPMLIPIVRSQLAEQFQTDGSLKIVDKESADCILYCRIVKVSNTTIRDGSSDGDRTYRPKEFRISVTAEIVVLVPGRSEPLIPLRRIVGGAIYQYESDPQIMRFAGLKQACYRLARQAVQYTTEAW